MESILDSKVFKIPIEEFEKELNLEPVKEKKEQILELFANSNKLHTKKEYDKIKYDLHFACAKGDLELIQIYLNTTISNETKSLEFKIDETKRTASLYNVYTDDEEFIIPRTIEHDSVEYLITSIISISPRIKTLKFEENSSVKTIYGLKFRFPLTLSIEEIYFPPSLKELKEGWCCNANYLTKIIISPSNDQFKFINDQYLIGKSESSNDEFDTLLFASRDIKEISIPTNIKIISSFAFHRCKNLTKVLIPPNSNLQIIESFAFSHTKIKEITIPSKVSKICECAFVSCENLKKVLIPPNSNLQTIESCTFSNTKIKEIYFPPSLKELKERWCCGTYNLTKIIISPFNDQFKFINDQYLIGKSESNNDEFDNLLFAIQDIKEISIPTNIKIISSYAFHRCKNLTKVLIPPNSNLQTIGKYAFYNTKIEEISIPTNIKIISSSAFEECKNLTKVLIPPNSNLQTIESSAFSNTKIEEILIPSKVSKICEYAFASCENLQIVEIPEDSKLESFPLSAFLDSPEFIIMIPSSIRTQLNYLLKTTK